MQWTDHDGKDYPRLGDMVLVRFRDGEETTTPTQAIHWAGTASNWRWNRRSPSDSEIVAYRRLV